MPKALPPASFGATTKDRRTRSGKLVRDVKDIWVIQPLDERWVAEFRIVTSGGSARVGEARIFPAERRPSGYPSHGDGEWSGCWRGLEAEAPRRGLTKQVLARAQPHMWLKMMERIAPRIRSLFPNTATKAQRSTESPSGRGRPAHDDVFLAKVAQEYARAVEAKRPPVQAVAAVHGAAVVKVRGWIHAARKRGFLTRSEQGVTAGQLTPKAAFVLETEDKRKRRK